MNFITKHKRFFTVIGIVSVSFLMVFSSFYSYWNSAPADKTCASCHEIRGSVHSFANSSHRDLTCKECHGTALSNGLHSLNEKSRMVINHIRNVNTENIRMNESQYLAMMTQCKRCHTSEFAKWEAGRHSATYTDIFLDSVHNSTEQLNFDCLRCHGMFYKGTIEDLVEPISISGPWKIKTGKQEKLPTIPCSACHMIHTEGYTLSALYADSLLFAQKFGKTGLSIFDRAEKIHLNVELLPKLTLFDGDSVLPVSDDLAMRNCVQCHSPNSWHEVGTSDDRTPRGVHTGLSCLACHDPHSNDAKNSCATCHPAISNCNLDVTTMNTTFANPNSPNNIHFVSCADCHGVTPKNKAK